MFALAFIIPFMRTFIAFDFHKNTKYYYYLNLFKFCSYFIITINQINSHIEKRGDAENYAGAGK